MNGLPGDYQTKRIAELSALLGESQRNVAEIAGAIKELRIQLEYIRNQSAGAPIAPLVERLEKAIAGDMAGEPPAVSPDGSSGTGRDS